MAMTDAEQLHRVWIVLATGGIFLFLTVLQIWTGRTLRYLAVLPGLVSRKKEPRNFWPNVVVTAVMAVVCFMLALGKLL